MGFAICSSAGAPLGSVRRAGCALRDPLDEGVAGADRVMARYELPDASVLDGLHEGAERGGVRDGPLQTRQRRHSETKRDLTR